MTFSVCFIERREGESPSIERVFRSVAKNLQERGIDTQFVKVPFGNSIVGTFLNIIFFRPPKADVLHITGHINYLGLVLPRTRTVSTFHDLAILKFRWGLRRWLIERLYFVWPARRLRFLTAISEETKTKLVGSSGINSEKVNVIQNPLLVTKKAKQAFNAAKPTILQIGTAPNKNVARLVSAISGINCGLRIVGKVSDELHRHIVEKKVELSNDENLNEADMETAYESADILTLCSTDEGFGLPIIEAQAKQTVVVTSDRPPMRNVAGGGAVLADPEDIESIRSAILRLISEPSLREQIVAKGSSNIERFDPSNIAAEYFILYTKIVRGIRN